jgi:hypothetical protein
VGGDDAVVEDELDVGLGAESGEGGGFVGGAGGVEDSDAEGLVDTEDVGAGEADVGFDVGGDGVGAVGDEIAVRDECGDGAGELRGAGGDGHDEEESEGKGNARMQSWGEGLSACGGGAGGMAQGAN